MSDNTCAYISIYIETDDGRILHYTGRLEDFKMTARTKQKPNDGLGKVLQVLGHRFRLDTDGETQINELTDSVRQ